MGNADFRIPSTTVSLILALAKGLREVLCLKITGTEAWDLYQFGQLKSADGECHATGKVVLTEGKANLRARIWFAEMTLGGATKEWWVVRIWVKLTRIAFSQPSTITFWTMEKW